MENGPSDVKLPKIRQEAGKNGCSDGKLPKIRQEAGKNGRSDVKLPIIRQEAVAPTCGGGSGPLGDAAGPAGGQPKWPGWRPGGIKSVAAFKGMAGLFGVLHHGPTTGDAVWVARIIHTRRLVERAFARNTRHPFI